MTFSWYTAGLVAVLAITLGYVLGVVHQYKAYTCFWSDMAKSNKVEWTKAMDQCDRLLASWRRTIKTNDLMLSVLTAEQKARVSARMDKDDN